MYKYLKGMCRGDGADARCIEQCSGGGQRAEVGAQEVTHGHEEELWMGMFTHWNRWPRAVVESP